MSRWYQPLLLTLCMVSAAIAGQGLKPHHKMADDGPRIQLTTMIPSQMGEWTEDTLTALTLIDSGQRQQLAKIYNQTLARTYKNAAGYRVMLSIAYGGDQSDAMELHKPEICYPAQGFIVHSRYPDNLRLQQKNIPITRLHTAKDLRVEPVTYWTTLGNNLVEGGLNKKLLQMQYNLVGKIPDGILVRVSSLDNDLPRAFAEQDNFIQNFINSLTPPMRTKMIGAPSLQSSPQ